MDLTKGWVPVSVAIAMGVAILGVGKAWGSNESDYNAIELRVTKVEIAVQNIAQTLDSVKESNISLKVGMDNLASRVSEVGKDVKDIRTAVR
jgi:hypothetical protein